MLILVMTAVLLGIHDSTNCAAFLADILRICEFTLRHSNVSHELKFSLGCCSAANSRSASATTSSTASPISHYQWHEVHANGIALPRRSVRTRGRDGLHNVFLRVDYTDLMRRCYCYCILTPLSTFPLMYIFRRIMSYCNGN